MDKVLLRVDPALHRTYPDEVAHSIRFRRVANRYPLQVTFAYGGDIRAAAADDDPTVAARVAAWERAQGLEPRDWVRIGREDDGRDQDQDA